MSPAIWRLKREQLWWNDGSHMLPKYYEYEIDEENAKCFDCGLKLNDGSQKYLWDETGLIERLKSPRLEHDLLNKKGATRHLAIYNGKLRCFECFCKHPDDVHHKVVVKIRGVKNESGL